MTLTQPWWSTGSHDSRRRVADPHSGSVWEVWELDTTGQPGARGERCLVFDAGDIVRRVWHVPERWADLPDAELLALLHRPPRA
jgi:hypothetical protein